MKRLVLFTILLLSTQLLSANDDAAVSRIMQQYWLAYTQSDFAAAAKHVLPSELQELKTELLPVFLEISGGDNEQLKPLADMFFSGMAAGSRADMTAAEVFAGVNNFIVAGNPDLFSQMSRSEIEITEISWSTADRATMAYSISIGEMAVSDFERFVNHQGKWYLRLKEPPRDTAVKFRQIFGL